MRPVATDVAHSVVCVSVCIGHTAELFDTLSITESMLLSAVIVT